jgi:hypothetical protein
LPANGVGFNRGQGSLPRDDRDQALVRRLLELSRGHPLIMDRLAALAGEPKALAAALDELAGHGLERLPDIYAQRLRPQEREAERAYLDEVAVGTIEWLIERLPAAQRRLLWVISLVAEPVDRDLLDAV